MLLAAAAVLLIAVTVLFTFVVRPKDVPAPEAVSPVRHLEERKAAIYENLRDLQFEYRVGKLSDADYQQTKVGLQKELAAVLAEIENFNPAAAPKPAPSKSSAPSISKPSPAPTQPSRDREGADPAAICPHCGATFPKLMKFCGECGKEMAP